MRRSINYSAERRSISRGFYGRLTGRRWKYGYYRAGKWRGRRCWSAKEMITIAEGGMDKEDMVKVTAMIRDSDLRQRRDRDWVRQLRAECWHLARWIDQPFVMTAADVLDRMEKAHA